MIPRLSFHPKSSLSTPSKCLLLLFFSVCFLHLIAPSHLIGKEPVADKKTPASGDDWLTFYYRNPNPDELMAQIKAWSSEGTLQDENARAPLVGFLSQVFHHNPERIQTWYQESKQLPEKDQNVIVMALWASSSEQGIQLLKNEFPETFADKTPPDILTLKLDSASALDLLWGYFFATGDSKALRRIVAMFKYADAPKKVKGMPEGRVPLYTVLPEAAKWSLSSNAQQHPKVLTECKKMLGSDQLNATEKKWLDECVQAAEKNLPQP